MGGKPAENRRFGASGALGILLGVLALGTGGYFAGRRAGFWGPGASAPRETGFLGPVRPAPEFALKDVRGKEFRLADFAGQVTLLHFWASWCPPCLEELGPILAVAEAYPERVKLVAITLDERWEDALKILPESKLPKNAVILQDVGAKVSDAYGSYQYPETYILNRKGGIVLKLVGPQNWAADTLRRVLERAGE